ncbi:MAG: thioredoxin family protein [Firmicutes bacterium]|nr:thioredoxin family protein [Bacillota bacterium]
MKEITQDEFAGEIERSNALVMFSGPGCGNCKMQEPLIKQLVTEFDTVKFLKLNSSESMDLVEKYDVRTLPTLLLIKNGDVVETMAGLKPKVFLHGRLTDLVTA